jgi:hypothetical protein
MAKDKKDEKKEKKDELYFEEEVMGEEDRKDFLGKK